MAEGEGTNTETPAKPPPTASGGGLAPVPYERFAEVNGAKRALAKEVETLRKQLADAQPVLQEVETLRAASAKWAEERTILAANVFDEPDEAIDLARTFYGKLPAEGKPASLADYVKSLTPETAPRALQAYIRKPVEIPPADGNKPPAGKPPPKVDNPGKPPPSQPAVSAEQIRAARLKAQRTGDTAELAALMEKVRSANAQTA